MHSLVANKAAAKYNFGLNKLVSAGLVNFYFFESEIDPFFFPFLAADYYFTFDIALLSGKTLASFTAFVFFLAGLCAKFRLGDFPMSISSRFMLQI